MYSIFYTNFVCEIGCSIMLRKMLFDTHAHLDDKRYDEDRDSLIASFWESGVSYVTNIGADMNSSAAGLALAEKYDFIYAAVGVHPEGISVMTDNDLVRLEEMLSSPNAVALGEIGLDYKYDYPKDLQLHWFEKQLSLARRLNVPVIIHDRDAHGDCMDMIRKYKPAKCVFHCYSGSVEMAKELVSYGYMISFTGVITFKNAAKLLDVVRFVPIENILIETDCPYLSPEPFRGTRNSPANVKYVAQKIADLKEISYEDVCRITTANALRFYGIEE